MQGVNAMAEAPDQVVDRRTTRKTQPVTQKQILDAMHEYASMFHACHGHGPEVVAKRAAVVALLDEAGVAP